MDKNKIIIAALILVIIVLGVGLFQAMSGQSKIDTKLTIKADSPLNEGDSIKIKLTDENGTAIVNQSVNISITDENNANSYYSVVTDGKGVGILKLDKGEGKYDVNCTYNGNDIYNANSTSKKIKIEKEDAEAETTSESSSDTSYSSGSSSRYEYDEAGTYDTYTGTYVGGQNDGQTKEQVEEYNRGIVEEEKRYKELYG